MTHNNNSDFVPVLSNNQIIQILQENYNEFPNKSDISIEKSQEPHQFKIFIKNIPKYILKIIPKTPENDLFEHSLSQLYGHLQRSQLAHLYQQPLQNKHNQPLSNFSYLFRDYHIRVLTFLNGAFIGDLFHNLGTTLGKQAHILESFPYTAHMLKINSPWDLKNFYGLWKHVNEVEDLEQRRICKYFLLKYNQHVNPISNELRQQVIQGDFNENNILVNAQNISQIYGFQNFQDMIFTHTINELAIAVAHSILLNSSQIQRTAYDIIQNFNAQYPLTTQEADILFWLVGARLSTLQIMLANNQLKPHHQNSSKFLDSTMRQFYRINPLHFSNSVRKLCNLEILYDQQTLDQEHAVHLKVRASTLPKTLSICYKRPLNLTQGTYQYIFDDRGRTYVDCANNVQHVGHSHPDVARVAADQYSTLNINTRYISPYLLNYCQELASMFPEPLKYVFLVNSGTEANELALRLARTYTKSKQTIVMEHGYHGNSNAIVEVSHYKFSRKGGKGAEPFIHPIPIPDPLRSQHLDYGKIVQSVIKKIKDSGEKVGAFLCESIISLGGYIIPPKNFFKTIYELVRKEGGVCIADEVQVGFGRVGEKFWAFELQDVIPDIVSMGKPIANGHPMGAVITTKEIADAFNNGMEYFNTFAGTQVSCRIAHEVLRIIKDENLQESSKVIGRYFKEQLRAIKSYLIADVRGEGLFIGMELCKRNGEPAVEQTKLLNEKLKDKGVLVGIDGYLYNVLKIKPSLVITKEDIDFVVEQFAASLQEIENEMPEEEVVIIQPQQQLSYLQQQPQLQQQQPQQQQLQQQQQQQQFYNNNYQQYNYTNGNNNLSQSQYQQQQNWFQQKTLTQNGNINSVYSTGVKPNNNIERVNGNEQQQEILNSLVTRSKLFS